ncbi:diguanylate cyclase [Deinococcus arenicola]|uniref:Diguanylate cyclase n=1 Tax=Deinococcus arenicola TaxID=2994950 RepID=A0ABU4DU21_9DEIO|nr:diguanylate cyclase [Deinococcus sp. ZS9-10]MDV6375925.1 diguanylate cyclase [Deinococcus sp. ZS9-10]
MTLRRLLLLAQIPFWVLLVGAFVLLSAALDARVQATERATRTRTELAAMGQVMQQVVNLETGLRGYVITGEPVFLEPYNVARAVLPTTLAELDRGNSAGRPRLNRIRTLIDQWQAGVALPEIAARQRSEAAAAALVKSGQGKKLLDRIRAEVAAYTAEQTEYLNGQEAVALSQLRRLRLTLYGVGGFALLASLLATLGSAEVLSRSFGRFTVAARRLTDGEAGVRVTPRGPAEIQALSGAFNHMSEGLTLAQQQAQTHAETLAARNDWMRRLGEFGDWMQAARSLEEGARILENALPALLPGTRGVLLQHNASRNLLLPLATWGGESGAATSPDGCWALRRGEMVAPQGERLAPPCLGGPGGDYTCVPLFSHGETLGLMRLRPAEAGEKLPAALLALLPGIVRQVSLSLAGLRLQDRLLQQSIRDPLTGLFNRRRLEDELAAQTAHATATGSPLSLIAIDVDHFKRLNDTFGHDAGDAALVRLSAALRELAPAGSTPARPGGEEFSLLLPGYDLTAATAVAERLRAEVAAWTLSHAGITLGQMTVSLGVAGYAPPLSSPAALVRAADEALYAAKRQGRNRVVLSEETRPEAWLTLTTA